MCRVFSKVTIGSTYSPKFNFLNSSTLASQSRFDPNWAVAQDLELELKSKLEPKLES